MVAVVMIVMGTLGLTRLGSSGSAFDFILQRGCLLNWCIHFIWMLAVTKQWWECDARVQRHMYSWVMMLINVKPMFENQAQTYCRHRGRVKGISQCIDDLFRV